jgi:hypothetical protein
MRWANVARVIIRVAWPTGSILDLVPARPTWMKQVSCRGAGTSDFFPDDTAGA